MDPILGYQLSTELSAVCISVARVIKKTIETMKNTKRDLAALLYYTERMRNMLELLRVFCEQVMVGAHKSIQFVLDDTRCRSTVKDLEELAQKIEEKRISNSLLGSLQWVQFQKKAVHMVHELAEQENAIVNALVMIAATSTIRTEREVQSLKQQAISQAAIIDAFGSVSISEGLPPAGPPHEHETRERLTWLGQVIWENNEYCRDRDILADAAKYGDWNTVFAALETGRREWRENWINGIRLKPIDQAHQISGWTPLHQAAYMRAPADVIRRMVSLGASRNLRTRWSNPKVFSHQDLTALEIAQNLGYSDLFESLSPVVRQPIPDRSLKRLESRFHELVRSDLGSHAENEHIYLPPLTILGELRTPQLSFLVPFAQSHSAAYLCRLDGRELLVKVVNIPRQGSVRQYRITADRAQTLAQQEVEDTILVGN